MANQSPTITGIKAVLRRPSAGLAEIAWRWSFGSITIILLLFTLLEYLDTLPVSSRDMSGVRTGRQSLILQALQHILRGSGDRLSLAVFIVVLALTAGWIAFASAGRLRTLRLLINSLTDEPQASDQLRGASGGRFGSLVTLNSLKALVLGATILGLLAVVILVQLPRTREGGHSGFRVLIFTILAALIWAARSSLNRLLSLAVLFVVAKGEYASDAFLSAVNLYGDRRRPLLVAGTWFGVARFVALVVAGSLATSSLALAGVLSAGLALLATLLVMLIYFALSDYLYVGKLAAYLAIILVDFGADPPRLSNGTDAASLPTARVDPDELIMSDVPTA